MIRYIHTCMTTYLRIESSSIEKLRGKPTFWTIPGMKARGPQSPHLIGPCKSSIPSLMVCDLCTHMARNAPNEYSANCLSLKIVTSNHFSLATHLARGSRARTTRSASSRQTPINAAAHRIAPWKPTRFFMRSRKIENTAPPRLLPVAATPAASPRRRTNHCAMQTCAAVKTPPEPMPNMTPWARKIW